MNEFLLRLFGATTILTVSATLMQGLMLALRPSSPSVRQWAWFLVLIQGLIWFHLPVRVPWHVGPSQSGNAFLAQATQRGDADVVQSVSATTAKPASSAHRFPAHASHFDWRGVGAMAWLGGMGGLAGLFGLSYVLLLRRISAGKPAPPGWAEELRSLLQERGIARAIVLWVTRSVGPALCGTPRGPRICVPGASWARLSPPQRQIVLRHELAHFERGDLWRVLAVRLLALPHWFNPVAWWAVHQFTQAGEWACDQAAAGPKPEDALTLAKALMQFGAVNSLGIGVAGAASRSSLFVRIRRLTLLGSQEDSFMKRALILATAAVLVAVNLVRVELVAKEPEGNTPATYSLRSPASNPIVGGQGSAAKVLMQGAQLLNEGRAALAAEKCREAAKSWPNEAGVWTLLGVAYRNTGRRVEAQQAFERVVAIHPGDPTGLMFLGEIAFLQRKYDQSEKYLLKAAAQGPGPCDMLARLYLLQGKYDQAQKWAQKFVDSYPGNDVERKVLQAAKEKHLSDSLRKLIEPSANWQEEDAKAARAASEEFFQDCKPLGVGGFRAALAANPEDANAWTGLGWSLLYQGKSAEAEPAFREALNRQPDLPGALDGLGQLCLSQRKYAEAEQYLLKAAPEAPGAWANLTGLYLLQGKFESAEKWAEKIVDSGYGNEIGEQLLQAAKKKHLGDSLRKLIDPPPAQTTAPVRPAAAPLPKSTTGPDPSSIVVDVRFVSGPAEALKRADARWTMLPLDLPSEASSRDLRVSPWPSDFQASQRGGGHRNRVEAIIEKSPPVMVEILGEEGAIKAFRAIESHPKVKVLLAPRLTMHDGQAAMASDAVQTPFVMGIKDGQPLMRTVPEGTRVDVRPVARPDGRIRLEFVIRHSRVGKVETVTVPGATGDAALGVQVPEVRSTQVEGAVDLAAGQWVIVDAIASSDDKSQPTGVQVMLRAGKVKRVVCSVGFRGNTTIPDARLRTYLATKACFSLLWLGWEIDADADKQIAESIQRLTTYYRGKGFFRARVGREFQFDASRRAMALTFVIDEGPHYQVRKVSFLGNVKFTSQQLSEKLKLTAGQSFDQVQMQTDMESIRATYGSIGYTSAKASPEPRFLEQPGQFDLVYRIDEGVRQPVGENGRTLWGIGVNRDAQLQGFIVLDGK